MSVSYVSANTLGETGGVCCHLAESDAQALRRHGVDVMRVSEDRCPHVGSLRQFAHILNQGTTHSICTTAPGLSETAQREFCAPGP